MRITCQALPFDDAYVLRFGHVVVECAIQPRQLGAGYLLGVHQRIDEVATIVRSLGQPRLMNNNIQRLPQPVDLFTGQGERIRNNGFGAHSDSLVKQLKCRKWLSLERCGPSLNSVVKSCRYVAGLQKLNVCPLARRRFISQSR